MPIQVHIHIYMYLKAVYAAVSSKPSAHNAGEATAISSSYTNDSHACTPYSSTSFPVISRHAGRFVPVSFISPAREAQSKTRVRRKKPDDQAACSTRGPLHNA
ncbi:hypothetical protein J3F84DRAFT_368247 [Trichoderma pleuroticola]